MDNLFSSPKLFSILRSRHIAFVGAMRSDVAGLPRSLAVRGDKEAKLIWGSLGAGDFADAGKASRAVG